MDRPRSCRASLTFLFYWWSQRWLLGGRVDLARAAARRDRPSASLTTVLLRLTRVIMPGADRLAGARLRPDRRRVRALGLADGAQRRDLRRRAARRADHRAPCRDGRHRTGQRRRVAAHHERDLVGRGRAARRTRSSRTSIRQPPRTTEVRRSALRMPRDVVVRIPVGGVDALAGRVLVVEPQPLHRQLVAQLGRRALQEVGHRLALLLVEVLAVLRARLADRLVPLVGEPTSWWPASRTASRIALWSRDRVLGLVLRVARRALLEQRRVEDRLLGLGVRVQARGQRLPDRGELLGRVCASSR